MNSRVMLRGGVIAAAALTTTVLAASAAQAHGSQSEPNHRNPGMQRMHELHMQGNLGMQRMHELHMQGHDGMHSMKIHGDGR